MKFSEVIAELETDPKKKFESEHFIIRASSRGFYYLNYLNDIGSAPQFNGNVCITDIWHEVKPSIEVGDKVVVVDAGESYSTYHGWFKNNNVDIEIACKYQYGRSLLNVDVEDMTFGVVAKGPHENKSDGMLCAIKGRWDRVYLVRETAIVKQDKHED